MWRSWDRTSGADGSRRPRSRTFACDADDFGLIREGFVRRMSPSRSIAASRRYAAHLPYVPVPGPPEEAPPDQLGRDHAMARHRAKSRRRSGELRPAGPAVPGAALRDAVWFLLGYLGPDRSPCFPVTLTRVTDDPSSNPLYAEKSRQEIAFRLRGAGARTLLPLSEVGHLKRSWAPGNVFGGFGVAEVQPTSPGPPRPEHRVAARRRIGLDCRNSINSPVCSPRGSAAEFDRQRGAYPPSAATTTSSQCGS